jgi:thiol-disulfide isomerase/thioredoxin
MPSYEGFEGSSKSVVVCKADWCGHCKRAMPEFIKLKNKYPDRVIMKESKEPDTDELMQLYSSDGFPSIVKQSTGDIFQGERTYQNLEKFLLG